MGKSLKYILIVILLSLFSGYYSYATHLKAGEITSQRISGFQYRFILTIYLDSEAVAVNPSLTEDFAILNFGDGTSDTVARQSQISLGKGTLRNIYTFIHTFSGSGTYTISYQRDNRNASINNIDNGNSAGIAFYIESTVKISPFLGVNNSPTLLYPPIDEGSVGVEFKHNPGAFDPEGDSISYELGVPKQFQGIDVPNYVLPNQVDNSSGTFTLNPITGDLSWNAPVKAGLYNIVIIIKEWRNGQVIGTIERDMQVNIKQTNNHPPKLVIPSDTCIVAGTKLEFTVTATDPDNDKVNMSATGGPLTNTNPKAVFTSSPNQPTSPFPATGLFTWNTTCALVRDQPYEVLFRVEDVQPASRQLFDLKSLNITVLGPQPQGLTTVFTPTGFQLNWAPYSCSGATIMEIYRRDCDSSTVSNSCGELAPGFKKIGEVPISTTTFLDSSIKPGSFFCYVLIARFPLPKGGKSLPSVQSCSEANEGEPLPLEASVLVTDKNNGKIEVRWTEPLDLNQTVFPGPYQYILKRGEGISGKNLVPVKTFTSLTDTLLIDSLINTKDFGYTYQLEFYYTLNGNLKLKSNSETFSSVFATAKPGNKNVELGWTYDVPWNNGVQYQKIYQTKPGSLKLVDSVLVEELPGKFTVRGLQNGDTACFYVETFGEYCRTGLPNPLINKSQIVCAVPHDTLAPCPPILAGPTACIEEGITTLTIFWKPIFDPGCNKEIAGYNVYYAEHDDEDLSIFAKNVSDTFLVDIDNFSLAGCYAVKAVNFYGQESALSNKVCVDICVFYDLPNLVTPNNDKHNDLFVPFPIPKNVKQVNFSVFNRWGEKVYFSSDKINLDWPGIDFSGDPLSSGIYFYEAEVIFRRRLRKEDEVTIIKGWVHVIQRENGGGRE